MIESIEQGPPALPSEEPVKFVADARLISVLGEQLIGSEKVGILELVKNAYDAGAKLCTVTLEGVPGLQPTARTLTDYELLPGPILEIRDDGSGMSKDDLIHGWLRPATPSRARIKEHLRAERDAAKERGSLDAFEVLVGKLKEAHGGRLPLGEKGIGRLATHRLGRLLWLRTKTADDPAEWELRIDWALFESLEGAPLNLDTVNLTLRHQIPSTEYGARGSGTVICSYGGRRGYQWTEAQIRDVGQAINALRSPQKAPTGFEPRFRTPHVPEKEMAPPLERVPAPFELVAIVDEAGNAELEVQFKPPAVLKEPLSEFKQEESLDLRRGKVSEWEAKNAEKDEPTGHVQQGKRPMALRRPACGPFFVHIRAWLRLPQWLGADYDLITDYLDDYGGIAVYRDGLATVPAQQAARLDWLGLTLTSRKKSKNITYYQLAGEVEIQQEHTLDLRDRASREGLIETAAARDLALLTRACVDQLQHYVLQVRDEWSKKRRSAGLSPATLRAHARVAADVAKTLVDHYDFRKDPLKLAAAIGGKKVAERVAAAADTLRRLTEQLKLQEDEREGLMEAAGFGLAIGVAVHEVGKLASAIASDVRQLHGSFGPGSLAAQTMESVLRRAESLLSEVQRLAPLRVTRGENARPFSVRTAIEAARNAFVNTLEDAQILLHVDREDFRIDGRFGAIAQVFANLFDNAIYWIKTEGMGGAIQVAVSAKDRTVLVADSGPGVSEKMKEHLFEPFYSEKSPPSGLGLYICRHYLGQCDATIRLARPAERSKLRGAQFVLDFSKSPAEES